MSACASGLVSNAIFIPSGDQRGVPVSGPPYFVSCTGIRPLLSLTQISLLPDRLERNATRLPSGEYCGLESYCVDEVTLTGDSFPSDSTRQIFASSKVWA